MSEPLVSIVVICHNYGEYLTQAVESVVNQTYENIEIIILNDGSTDDTDSVAKRLMKKYRNIRYISQENQGIIKTRNRAINEVRGVYYIQLDADDYLDYDYVAKTVRVAVKEHVDIVYTDFATFGNSGTKRSNFPPYSIEYLKNRNYMHISSLIKLSSIGEMRFDEGLLHRSHEDWDFYLNVCTNGATAAKCTDTLLHYRQHGQGRNNNQQTAQERLNYLDTYKYVISKHIQQDPQNFDYLFGLTASKWYTDLMRDHEHLEKAYTEQAQQMHQLNQEIADIRSAISFRIGNLLATPVRFLKVRAAKLKPEMDGYSENILNKYYNYSVNRKKIKVAIILKNVSGPSSSSFIRLIYPLVKSKRYQLEIIDGDEYEKISEDTRVCVVQRVALREKQDAVKLLNILKNKNIPLVTDTDDAFCDIDKSHPEYEDISRRSEALTWLIENADINMFSTQRLVNIYNKLVKRKDGVLIENTLDKNLWRRWNKADVVTASQSPLQVLYMGTPTHGSDFKIVEKVFDRLHEESPGSFVLSIMGVSRELQEKEWIRSIDIEEIVYPGFVRWFSKQGPFDIGISPLVDNEFNKNKSDIKCLDYLASGVYPVVSDVEPYSNPQLDGLVSRVKNTEQAWYQAIKQHINDKQRLRDDKDRILSGYQYLTEYRSAEKTTKQLEAIFDSLLEKRSK